MKMKDGRQRHVFGLRYPLSLGRRLLYDTSGQVLMFGVILVIAILAFLLVIPNGTQVTTQKMRAQTAADAGAFTGSVWLARALNLNANMNIGIKSAYTWMTVLTMSEALAKALYSDTLDPSVRAMGQGITTALFGSSNPVTVGSVEYPGSIQKLDTTAQWLYALQDDIATSFNDAAATLGTEEACRNMGVYPPSTAAGGCVQVRTNDTVSLLVASAAGDSLMYASLLTLGPALDTIPINDSTIGAATGTIVVDPTDLEIKAYYGVSSTMYDVRQVLTRKYPYYAKQIYWLEGTTMCLDADTAYRCFDTKNQEYTNYVQGKTWIEPHTDPPGEKWYLHSYTGGTNKFGRDTVVCSKHVCRTPSKTWNYHPYKSGCGICNDAQPYVAKGDSVDSSMTVASNDHYAAAESTTGLRGPTVRPRRVNPNRVFHAVSYVWRQGASTAPYGLGAPLGGALFPRSAVAAPSPMIILARSEPYLTEGTDPYVMQIFSKPSLCHATVFDTAYKYFDKAGGKSWDSYLKGDSWVAPFQYPPWTMVSSDSGSNKAEAEDGYFFSPAWDVRLTPMDSTGLHEICSDTGFSGHSRNAFNLEELRKYALLP